MRFLSAPLQGYTDSAWRSAHAEVLGPDGRPDAYYSPFIRVEKGTIRPRDLRDIADGPEGTIPQIIFKDTEEFTLLADTLTDAGHSRIDLNLGCPFPPQCHKGRGAAMVGRPDMLEAIAERMKAYPAVTFSLKMRLGAESPDEWERSVEIIDSMPLCHVAIHPRTAKQQYKGELHMEQFSQLASRLSKPIIFNGDISTPADIRAISPRYPTLAGVMCGRGLLSSPWLAAEWRTGTEWSHEQRMECLLAIHRKIYDIYSRTLCGEAQLLSKLLPFWEYPAVHLDPRIAKAIRKSRTLVAYNQAISNIRK